MRENRSLITRVTICCLSVLVAGSILAGAALAQDSTKAAADTVVAKATKAATAAPAAAKPAVDTAAAKAAAATPAAKVAADTAAAKTMKASMKEGMKANKEEAPAKEKVVAEPEDPTAPYKSIKFAEGEKPRIKMETSMGTIIIELWPDVALKHSQSFVYLTNKGFYDSLKFHRIVPGFVIQGGDPLGNGTGGPGYSVPAEFSNKLHEDGILSMARSQNVNSAGSQFFICLGRLTSLDNKYTVFGKVVEGLDIVHKIEKVPTVQERPKTPVVMTKVSVMAAEE